MDESALEGNGVLYRHGRCHQPGSCPVTSCVVSQSLDRTWDSTPPPLR